MKDFRIHKYNDGLWKIETRASKHKKWALALDDNDKPYGFASKKHAMEFMNRMIVMEWQNRRGCPCYKWMAFGAIFILLVMYFTH